MLFWGLFALQMLAGIVAGEAAIRKTPQGKVTLNSLSKAGLFFLKWRAYSNFKKDLVGLQNIFGIGAILFTIIFFVLGKRVSGSTLALLPGLLLILWGCMRFGTDFKNSVKELCSYYVLFPILPWLLFITDYFTNYQYHLVRAVTTPLVALLGNSYSEFLATLVFSAAGLVSGVLFAIMTILFASIIPLFCLFLIVVTSKISSRALQFSPRAAYNVTLLYFFVVGPTLIALDSKGII